MPLRSRCLVLLILSASCCVSQGQIAPIALPSTVSTYGGGGTATYSAGTPCFAGAPVSATDNSGDGCSAALATFSSDLRGGVAASPTGDVYVMDTSTGNSTSSVRIIQAKSGVVQILAGRGTVCTTGKTDSNGDGCPAASTLFSSTPRGIAADPYGNVLVAGYNSHLINLVCQAVSPLCPNTAGRHLVGYMYAVAGCVASSSSAGTSGNGADGGIATPTGSCSTSVAELNAPRGVAADRFGNVYIADTGNLRYRVVLGPQTYNGVTNPLFALIQANPTYAGATLAAGNIYPILGGFTPPASGAACSSGSSSVALDALGDGCPYYVASFSTASTSAVQGVAADLNGNILFTDLANSRLRVIYLGGSAMAAAITANNPAVTMPAVGSIYSLAGGGASTSTTSPQLGSAVSLDTNAFKITTDANGNIYIGDSTFVLFYDVNTGYIRRLVTNGTGCAASTDAIYDGCSATQTSFGGSNGLGVAVNPQGDLFLADTNNARVRRVAATSLSSTAVNGTSMQILALHGAPGTTGIAAVMVSATTGNPIVSGSVTCGAANSDSTLDCSLPVTFAPINPGLHSAVVAVSPSGGTATSLLRLAGNATGPALAFDVTPSTPASAAIGSGLKPTTLALDTQGNLYTYDLLASALTKVSPAGNTVPLPGALLAAPKQIAVDPQGNVYAVGDGSASIIKVTLQSDGSYSAGTVSFLPNGSAGQPQAIAVDNAGNLYVYDATSAAIYRVTQSALGTLTLPILASGITFTPTNINSLAVDPEGDLYISDAGAQKVYSLPGNRAFPWTVAPAAIAGSTASSGIAADPAGDAYTLQTSTLSVVMYPLSGAAAVTVDTGLTTPSGLAADNAGNLYIADSSQTGIVKITRSTVTLPFGTSTSTTQSGVITNTGSATGSGLSQTDSADFQLVAGAANGCTIAGNVFGPGSACSASATFTPQSGSGNVTDVVTLLPAASSSGALSITGTKSGGAVTTTTSIGAPSPASPIYSTSGTEVNFTVTVSASSGAASGSISVTVDASSPVTYTLDNTGIAAVALSGLSAGAHSITASYASQNGFTGSSTASATSFSIGQAAVTVSWTPTTVTQLFSRPLGLAVLNASAVIAGTSATAPGSFVYTATPSGGSASAVDASTYLAIGSYSLAATFVPSDSADYTGGAAGIVSYTVTKATTAAGVGGTQNLVAADGSGNFSSIQTALNSLPASGGSLYLKPGTYSGFVTVNLPNVGLRGLGGDPTQVILTNEQGAFSPPYLAGQGAGNNGSTGDQGSATLVVAKGTVNGVTATPNNFYMEGVTVANTYDTDTTNSSSVGTVANVCQAIAPASTSALYNGANTSASPGLCNSQALALWITADQAVLDNVRLNSLQDTLYAGSQGCGATCTVARQYYWHGKITGDVDFVFGDAAAVFDHTTIYTVWHGATATGTETIEAQNKKFQAGSAGDYLSGYVFNRATFTSQSTGMTNLYFGRPYGQFSTNILLNSYVDQINPLGYIEFSGDTNLPTSTYAEFNTTPYTDPTPGQLDLNGIVYSGTGGNTGSGVSGPRETTSIQPTTFTAAQAAPFFPINFLSSPVAAASLSTGDAATWDPTAALASGANGFVPASSPATIIGGTLFTILMRPQTPGAGAIPTGAWTLFDGGSQIGAGTLDASGQAYFSTTTLTAGTHSFTWTYSGDANFSGSTTASPYVVTITPAKLNPLLSLTPQSASYGAPALVAVSVSASSGTTAPTGTVSLSVDAGAATTGTLSSTGAYTFQVTGLSAGTHSLALTYSGDSSFNGTTINGSVTVAKAVLQVAAANLTIAAGAAVPPYTALFTGFAAGDTVATATSGAPFLSTNPATPSASGVYTITAATGTLLAPNYTLSFINGTLTIQPPVGTAAVATGDARTVTEPGFPAVCTQLTALLTSVSDDLPTSVDASSSNPDGARIQTALNGCANTNQAVRLSTDAAGHNAFLSGPLTMPSGVTLLVDPAVTLYFSRNVQDYDATPGTHTCGTVNSNTATASCLPLINVKNVSNVGIMGYGRLDGRGGDTLLNAFPASYSGQSWWGLSAIANSGGSQQNPRFIQIGGASNVTLYKITLRNSPLFHVSTTSAVTGFTAWDIKIVTPTSARNTDGIDPGNTTNATITNSWISDGDDNVAVGASGTTPSTNISVVGNHFFAGHGESIGSYTSAGVSNVLFDSNMLAGNSSVDSNSTGIRIKSANDRGGLVQNIQYSNSCFQNHKSEIQFTPLYNTNTGTLTPNFKNILLQNLSFLTEGTVQFTGANNSGTVNPLSVTLDNVSFKTLAASDFNAAPTNAQLTYGPGQVSSNFVSAYATFVGSNGNTVTDTRTAASLVPPNCAFTFLAPELTGPSGASQTIVSGQTATAVVILTPAVGGAAYPTGAVTLTDQTTGSMYTATLSGAGDTLFVPLPGLSVGTHIVIASYAGDANYVPAVAGAPYSVTGTYTITVTPGNLGGTSTALSGAANATYGNALALTATVAGASPTGTVQFVVNGAVASSSALAAGGLATTSLNLPVGTYTIQALYSGDGANAGSSSIVTTLTIAPAGTTTVLAASSSATTLGVPIRFTATVGSVAGLPGGAVTFSYTTATNSTPTAIVTAALTNGVASASVNLPIGMDAVTATFAASGSFATSSSNPIPVTVNPPVAVPLSTDPVALPYTISTVAGGATAANANTGCAGSTDSFGNGCAATSVTLAGSALDLRSVVADPFGSLYFTDANASQVRRIAPNGIVSLFAGYVSGTACTPTANTACNPTLVKLNKPRGISTDSAGNLYIAGYSDSKVYKISVSTGLLSLVAGTGTKPSDPTQSNGDGGVATSALLNQPRGVWADSVGNVYIADTADNKIRVVDITGNIQIVAGTGATASTGDGGPANQASVNNPQGVLTDASGNVYIAEAARIRVVCVTCTAGSGLSQLLTQVGIASPQNGSIYTLAGGGAAAYTAPALATSITMAPQKLAVDAGGNLYVSDGGGSVWFIDSRTAYLRRIAGGATAATTCNPAATPDIGDGCPATQAIIGDGGNGIGVGTDTQGNLYISDTLNARIRKVSNNLAFSSAPTGASLTATLDLHFIVGDTTAAPAIAISGSEYAAGTQTCVTNSDTTTDCTVPLNITPALPGTRTAALSISSANGHTAHLGVTGTGLGAGATLDPATQLTFGTNLKITGLAVDSSGAVYVSDAVSKQLLKYTPAAQLQGAGAPFTSLATLGLPGPVSVDARGYVYVADTSTGQITQVSPSGVTTVLTYKFVSPAGLTTDVLNNVYVSDSAGAAVYQLNPITGAQKTLAITGLIAPAGLAIGPDGSLVIADPGAAAVVSFNISSHTTTTLTTAAAKPSIVTLDAAGNLILADVSSILVNPTSANSAAFLISSIAPSALAIDGAGDIYTNSAGGSVLLLQRTRGALSFSSAPAAAQGVTLLSSGNQPLSTSLNQTDAADFTLTLAPSSDCTISSGGVVMLPAGGTCSGNAGFTPAAYGSLTNTLTLAGNSSNAALSNPSVDELVLTGANPPPATSVTLGALQTASPSYGQATTVTATVTSTTGTPTGSVIFSLDGATTSVPITSAGIATFTLPTLTAGLHTLSANYPGAAAFAASSTSAVAITIAKVIPTISAKSNASTTTFGASITLTATLAASVGTPTGTVQFSTAAGPLGSPATLSGGVASLTTNSLPAGSNSIVATYTGDTNFNPIASAAFAVAVQASTTLSLSASPAIPAGGLPQGAAESFTALLTGAVTPTGTVTFYDGTTAISSALVLTGTSVSFSPSAAFAVGNHFITAKYSGDSLNQPSTSPALNFASLTSLLPGFTLTEGSLSSLGPITVRAGGSTAVSLTVSPGTLYAGTIAFSCPGNPASITCSFNPPSLTFTAGSSGSQSTTLTLTAASAQARVAPRSENTSGLQLAAMLGAPWLLLVLKRRRGVSRLRLLTLLLFAAAATLGVLSATGCGGSHASTQTYQVVISATDGANTRTIPLSVEVTN